MAIRRIINPDFLRVLRRYLFMLERCAELTECEQILSEKLREVTFLGQVELSREDIEKLGNLIREQISPDVRQGTRFLEHNAVACLSFFLVGVGVWRYREGNYWSAVSELAGLDDVNWQVRWGRIFLEFLGQNGLPRLDLEVEAEGAHRYVTPILLHGGIPQSCLDEFFGKVVRQMVDSDVVDPDDVRDWLFGIREQEDKLQALRKEIRRLSQEEATLSPELKNLDELIKLKRKARELSAKAERVQEYQDLPEDCPGFLMAKETELVKLRGRVAALEKERAECRHKIEAFTESDERVLEYALAIDGCRRDCLLLTQEQRRLTRLKTQEIALKENLSCLSNSLFSKPWQEEFGEIVERLDFDRLAQDHQEYVRLKESRRELTAWLSQYAIAQPKLRLTFWLGLPLLPAGLALFFLAGKPFGLLALLGFIGLFDGLTWFRIEKRIERRQKEKREEVSRQLSETQARLGRIETEIFEQLKGLPLAPDSSPVTRPDLARDLKMLNDVFREYGKCVNEREDLERRFAEWERQVREVAASATRGVPLGSPDDVVNSLAERLALAREKGEGAKQARESLEQKIEPELRCARDGELRLDAELRRVKERLCALGKGDLATGIEELTLMRQSHRELQKTEEAISILIETLGGHGKIPDEVSSLEELRRSNADKLQEVKDQLRINQKELSEHTSVSLDVDRPVERFLLYGGQWAEEWLIESVKVMDQAKREGQVPEKAPSGLPGRVIAQFKNWWKENHPADGPKPPPPEQEHFSAPVLSLDTRHAELKIVLGRCRFMLADIDAGQDIILKISASELTTEDTPGWSEERSLRGYRPRRGWVETEEFECSVPLARGYDVTLLVAGESRQSWRVPGLAYEKPYLAFTEEGRLITEERLPRRRLWLLLLTGSFISPGVRVIEEATPPAPLRYRLYLINLNTAGPFCIVDHQGGHHPIIVAESFEPQLRGGTVIPSVFVENATVYTGEPPTILLPLNEAGIEGWSIIVRYGAGEAAERRRYLVSELPICRGEGCVEIPLALPQLLGPEPKGRFMIRLRRRLREHVFELAVVPDLLVIFEPEVVLPVEQDEATVALTVVLTEGAKFNASLPARVLAVEDDAYKVSVPVTEETVEGRLEFGFPDEASLAVSIRLPKIRWRLRGFAGNRYSDWSCRVKELWIGDWLESGEHLSLEVELQPDAAERLELYLHGSTQTDSQPLREGVARFPLSPFTDTLRGNNAEISEFRIRLNDHRGELVTTGSLFRVRSRWEVELLDWSVNNLQDRRRLDFRWQEKGAARNKVLRLWRLWEPWAEPLLINIPVGENCLSVDREKVLLPPGPYLVQFMEEDPWSEDRSFAFPRERLNVFEIEIEDEEPYIKSDIREVGPGRWEVSGAVRHVEPGTKITGILYGVEEGQVKTWQCNGSVTDEGRFSLSFARCFAHWFGLFIETTPLAYQIEILPQPEPLMYSLVDLAADEINEILTLRGLVEIGIRIHCHEGHLDQPVLPPDVSVEIVQRWIESPTGTLQLILRIGGREEEVNLGWSAGEVVLSLEKGVICTTICRDGRICDKILPNQQAWYDHCDGSEHEHLPGEPRSMRVNYQRVPATLLLTCDAKPAFQELRRRYSLAGQALFVLFSSLNRPLPNGLSAGGIPDPKETVRLLWAREKKGVLVVAERGGRK